MTTLSMKQLVKRQKGRPAMKKQNRRTMQIRFSLDEQLMVLDALEILRKRYVLNDEIDHIRIIDILIERTAALQ